MRRYVYKTVTISEEEFRKDTKKWIGHKESGVDGMCVKVIGDNDEDRCSFTNGGPLFAGEATWKELKENPKAILEFAEELQGIYIVDAKGQSMFVLKPTCWDFDKLVL